MNEIQKTETGKVKIESHKNSKWLLLIIAMTQKYFLNFCTQLASDEQNAMSENFVD